MPVSKNVALAEQLLSLAESLIKFSYFYCKKVKL